MRLLPYAFSLLIAISPFLSMTHGLSFHRAALQPLVILWPFHISEEQQPDPEQTPDNFWEEALALGDNVYSYARQLLHEIPKALVEQVDKAKESMTEIVAATAEFREKIIDPDTFSQELTVVFSATFEQIKEMFPPPDQAPSHEQRKETIHGILELCEKHVVALGVKHGVDETSIHDFFERIGLQLEQIVLICADVIEQHPYIAEGLVFALTVLIIPEGWFLRPFVELLGFGPKGPRAMSAAAWAQSRFFGGAIPAGSWFSHLQRAGMKGWSWWRSIWEVIRKWFGF
ncbi:hypothetical protein C8J56DRAFT_890384 [Mycena floridula]|nr:hypothetical protein C8J56DRAFT_890384 [Mycena floridula]